jgi:hypothetical protein
MTEKVKIKFYNFFRKKTGQRNTPYVYFYFVPLIAWSRTVNQSINLHIGWLYFTILITIKNDYRRKIFTK